MKLIKVPFSAGGLGKTKGCELAPDKIVEKLKEFHLSEEGMLVNFDVDEIKVDQNNIEKSFNDIIENSKIILKNNDKPIFIGGDHSITFPLVKGFSSVYPEPGIVIFDAHPDCQSDFEPPTHEDLVVGLIKNNIIKKENIIIVGVRNWHKDEYKFIKENRIKYFDMKELSMEGIKEVSESVMSVAKNFGSLYISVDIDVLDPGFAPGTGYPEPGGLTTRELLFFLHRLKKLHNLKAMDIVEVNPDKDVNELTSKLGAKLVVELE
ncbi:arginase family protein [Candidatus Woesearchaeota archaeon]|nr:arginase family protein [Candidatus Woesearchaeota archaeon]